MIPGIVLKFTCRGCGADQHPFEVPYRGRNQDLLEWMETIVRPAMGVAHRRHAPMCLGTSCDLWIPISEAADGIGKRVLS